MRAFAIVGVLAGGIAWMGCSTNVNMGGQIKPADTLFALDAGGACSKGSDCVSGLCLGGACCALTTCGSDPSCKGTACDATGACIYPTASCGTPTCNASTQQLTTSACDQGSCVAGTPSQCPDHLTCANGTACRTSCVLSSDCVSGFYCSAGSCLAQLAAGSTCTSSDSCATGICGIAGSGHCCTATCVSGDAYGCGGTDCDTAGSCVYPPVTTSCVAQSCNGHELTEPASCNGAGICAIPAPAIVDCAPYLCGTNGACKTTCTTATDCWNAFCSSAATTCCPFYSSSTIQVDGTQGVDQACCGSANGTSACATIAYAAALAVDTGVMPMTLAVANPPNGKDWTGDQFPIALGQGLILSAPGLYFAAIGLDAGPWELLLVSNPATVVNPVPTVVEGSASAPIHLGFDSLGNLSPASDQYPGEWSDHSDIVDVDHATLNLLQAEIRSIGTGVRVGGQSVGGCDAGCTTFEDGTLTIGNDGLGNSGTVWISGSDGGSGYGIRCGVSGGLVTDTGSTIAPSLWVHDTYFGVSIDNGCSVRLTVSPRFGEAINDAGTCDSTSYQLGLYFDHAPPAPSKGVVNNATFECLGLGLVGVGDFSGDQDLFEFNSFGAELLQEDADEIGDGGHVTITNSIFRNNSTAIDANGAVDLSGGNTITCNDILFDGLWPGIGLKTSQSDEIPWKVNAENIRWDKWDDDAGHTQTWACGGDDAGVFENGGCICSGDPYCPSDPHALPFLPNPIEVLLTVYSVDAGPPYFIDDVNGAISQDGCP